MKVRPGCTAGPRRRPFGADGPHHYRSSGRTETHPDFTVMPIGRSWRAGSSDESRDDVNPWSGEVLISIQQATADDLDEAYAVAAEAQVEWAAQPPAARAGVMRAAADVMTARKDELTGDRRVHHRTLGVDPAPAAGLCDLTGRSKLVAWA